MRAAERRTTRFEVTEPNGRVVLWIWMLCFVLPLSVTAVALGSILASANSGEKAVLTPVMFALTIVGALAIVLPLAILLQRTLRRLSVEFDGASLHVRAGWYRLSVAIAQIDVAHARVMNLAEHKEYRPTIKTNAMNLPGFDVGHYRLRDWRRKAFVLLTTRDKVLMLPLHDKRTVLLSLRRPQQLIDALRAATE